LPPGPGPRVAAPPPAAPRRGAALRRWWVAGVAGVLVGAALGYLGAAQQFREQITATVQAGDLRVQAANQRIAELQAQQREAAEQAQRQQLALADQAEDQQRNLVRQTSAQEHAAAAQQRSLLAQAQQRAADAQQAAAQAQQHERELARPDLPLRVWVHKPLVGRGLVGQLHNFGATDLNLTVTWRPASGAAQQWRTTVATNANLTLGRDAPWSLGNGDDLQFEAEGFRPLDFPIRPRPKAADPAPK
jgi:hypothetical protein